MERFGEKLKALRTSRGMTLQQLAKALGYAAHGYISEIESGRKQPTVNFVLAAAELFDVTTDELVRDKLKVNPSRLKRKAR
jgi:transcriptional regulator with XRE-family HTH domain